MEDYASLKFLNASLASTPAIDIQDCKLDRKSLQVPLAVVYTLLFLFGLVGNLLALWVFLQVHSKKNSIRIFLINLALADLLFVICLPFRVVYHSNNNRWKLPPLLCRIVGNVFYMNMYLSIGLLGLISVDRYLKVNRVSSRQRLLHRRVSVILCGVIWSVSLFVAAPLMFQASENNESQQCFQYKRLHMSKWRAYINFALVAMFWLVYGTLIVSYGQIGMKLIAASKAKPGLPNSTKYIKTAKKAFFVLFSFTVCYVPYHIIRVFYILSQMAPDISCSKINVLDETNEVVLLLSALNCCLDPVMYFLFCCSIRKTTLKIIRNCLCPKPVEENSSSSSI